MKSFGIGEIRRYINKEFTRSALPVSITSDGEVVAVILSVGQYNKLVKDYQTGAKSVVTH